MNHMSAMRAKYCNRAHKILLRNRGVRFADSMSLDWFKNHLRKVCYLEASLGVITGNFGTNSQQYPNQGN